MKPLAHVAFDGWHDKTLKAAAEKVGASDAELKAAFRDIIWLGSAKPEAARRALRYVGGRRRDFSWGMIKAAWASPACPRWPRPWPMPWRAWKGAATGGCR